VANPYWCRHCGRPCPVRPHHDCPDAPDGPFAAALADGQTVIAAARAAGYHPKHGQRVLQRIRDALGWQAT
jgi:hypothetical protein